MKNDGNLKVIKLFDTLAAYKINLLVIGPRLRKKVKNGFVFSFFFVIRSELNVPRITGVFITQDQVGLS